MANLEKAKRKAAELMTGLPIGAELDITRCDEDIWLGVGYYVGRGWAVYRGDNCYRLTEMGRPRILADLVDF